MITLNRNFICLSMCLLFCFCSVSSFPVETDPILELLLQSVNLMDGGSGSTDKINENSKTNSNIRVKRDSKTFKDAGETSQLKVLKQFVQMFRNYSAKKPMGGRHPFDPTVPLILCRIIKSKILKVMD